MMNRFKHIFIFIMFPYVLFSQISKKEIPLSILNNLPVPIPLVLAQPDWLKIQAEDKGWIGQFRFAAPTDVDLSPDNSGQWTTLPTGDRLWQLYLSSKNALGLALTLENFELPRGSKLHFISTDKKDILGSYDSDNNVESHIFFLGFIKGESGILTYFEPKSTQKAAKFTPFTIKKVYHAYQKNGLLALGFGGSLPCEINVNCAQGATVQTQKRGVVRILMVATEGVGWCSGSLVNNTRQDGTPYVLSAYHCADGLHNDFNQYTFYFNYESPNCTNPAVEPTLLSLQGCAAKSGARETDFLLFELNQRVPSHFNAHFNGWNRDSFMMPAATSMVHHPQGDIKKVSLDHNRATLYNSTTTWDNGTISLPRSHMRVVFSEGTMEGGSSGAPIFDASGRIVAQLHGGEPLDDPCFIAYALGGWLAKSWDGNGTPTTRLRDWLDPNSTGVMVQNGTATPITARVSGRISTWWGANMPNQKIFIGTDSTLTNATGNFTFTNIPINTPLNVHILPPNDPSNGVDAVDLLLMRRHILGLVNLNSNFKLFAGDVDNNQDIDAIDLLYIRRLILELRPNFPVSSWRFIPSALQNDPNFPFNLTIPSRFQITFNAATSSFDFIATKIGDVDASAE